MRFIPGELSEEEEHGEAGDRVLWYNLVDSGLIATANIVEDEELPNPGIVSSIVFITGRYNVYMLRLSEHFLFIKFLFVYCRVWRLSDRLIDHFPGLFGRIYSLLWNIFV
jgi:hypothetical protein